ncbi:hypothetical protein MMPV_000207 [Pyropia vietnamensis]
MRRRRERPGRLGLAAVGGQTPPPAPAHLGTGRGFVGGAVAPAAVVTAATAAVAPAAVLVLLAAVAAAAVAAAAATTSTTASARGVASIPAMPHREGGALLPLPSSREGAANREATDAALALSSLRPAPGSGAGGGEEAAARGADGGGPRRSPLQPAPRPPTQLAPTPPRGAYPPRGAGGEADDTLATEATPSDSRDSTDSDRNLATDPCTTTNGGEEDGSGGDGGGGGGDVAPGGGAARVAGADHHPPSSAVVDKAGSRVSGGTSGAGGGGVAVGGGGGGGRWKPTESQRRLLSATFAQNPYPDVTTKNLLAEQLGVNRPRELNAVSSRLNLSVKQIKLWMKHRRSTLCRRGEISFLRNRTVKHSLRAEDVAALRGARVMTATPTAAQLRALAAHLQVDTPLVAAWFERQSMDSVCDSSPSQAAPPDTPVPPQLEVAASASAAAAATGAKAAPSAAVAADGGAAGVGAADAATRGAVGLPPTHARWRSGAGASHARPDRSCSPSETSSFNRQSAPAGRTPRVGSAVPPPRVPVAAASGGRKALGVPSQPKRQRTSMGGAQSGEGVRGAPVGPVAAVAAAALRDGAEDGAKAGADPLRLGTSVTPDLREPWARSGDPRVAPAMYTSPNLGESLGTMDTLPTMTPPLMQQSYFPPGFYSPIPVSREGVNTTTPSYWANVSGGRRQHPLPQEMSMTSPLLRQPEAVMRSETGRNLQSPMPSPGLVGPPGYTATPPAAAAAVAEAPELFPGVNPTPGLTPAQAMYYSFPHSFHPMYQSQMMQYSMSRLSGGASMALHPVAFPAMPAGQGAKGQSPSAQDAHAGGGSTAVGHPPGVAAGAAAAGTAMAAAVAAPSQAARAAPGYAPPPLVPGPYGGHPPQSGGTPASAPPGSSAGAQLAPAMPISGTPAQA